jgi:hypothetical protein
MMTPYAAHKLVNAQLADHELKAIPPQMIYNYVKKGYIPSTDGKVSEDDVQAWTDGYVERKLSKATVEA